MKYLFLLAATMSLICGAFGAPLTVDDAKALEARAKKAGAAFDAGDVDLIVEMTHSSLIALVGGKEKLIEITRNAMTHLKEMDIEVIESELGMPTEAHQAADELVCFYPRTSVIRVGDKKARSIGFLVCLRKSNDGEWLFLDGAGISKNPELLKMLLPALPADVKLPENNIELLE